MYRIMIVEDDEVIARAVQQSLVSWGMDAFCVQDISARKTGFLSFPIPEPVFCTTWCGS